MQSSSLSPCINITVGVSKAGQQQQRQRQHTVQPLPQQGGVLAVCAAGLQGRAWEDRSPRVLAGRSRAVLGASGLRAAPPGAGQGGRCRCPLGRSRAELQLCLLATQRLPLPLQLQTCIRA